MSALRLIPNDNDAGELTPREHDVLLLARYFSRELSEDEATAVEARMVDDERFYAMAEPMMILRRTPGTLRPARRAVVVEWLRQSAAMVMICIGLGGAGVLAYVYGIGYVVATIKSPDLFLPENSMEAREAAAAVKLPDYPREKMETAASGQEIVSRADTVLVRLSNGIVVRLHPGSRFTSEGQPWPIDKKRLRIRLLTGAADTAMPYKEMPPLHTDLVTPAGELELHGGSFRLRCSKGCAALEFAIETGVIRVPDSLVPKGEPFELLGSGEEVKFSKGRMERLNGLIGQKGARP